MNRKVTVMVTVTRDGDDNGVTATVTVTVTVGMVAGEMFSYLSVLKGQLNYPPKLGLPF